MKVKRSRIFTSLAVALALGSLFLIYVIGIHENPPGFYVDESALSYNAYLVATTGAGETGVKFPLYFPVFTGGYTQYSNPTQIYLLAALFFVVGPSILAARLFAAACMFAACILLGLLGYRMTGSRIVGVIVGSASLLTPWLFETGRLVMETFFYPISLVLFLFSVYLASRKDRWSWLNVAAIVGSLALITYSYTIGRMLGPLLAFGLIFLVTNRQRAFSLAKAWVGYALSTIPFLAYIWQKPEMSTRFYLISYIKQNSTWPEILSGFASRFVQDINPVFMLTRGDVNPRHHMPDAYGNFYIAIFVLAVIGVLMVLITRWREAYWRFALWGLIVAYIPGAMTADANHSFRMIAVPIFLLLFTIPAIEWLIKTRSSGDEAPKRSGFEWAKAGLLAGILLFGVIEAGYFHKQFYTRGKLRGYVFDAAYKTLYDAAVAQPKRPIYLVDGYWGPMYIHSFWYATVEGRDRNEFVHQPHGQPPPPNVVVISSNTNCTNCTDVKKEGDFIMFTTLP